MKKIILMLALLIGASAAYSQILVPYRVGKLWGLADTLGRIKLAPQYDEIDASATHDYWLLSKQGYQFFVIRKGKHYGLLNRTQVVMQPKYHKLRLDSVFVEEDNSDPKNPTMSGSKIMLYNLNGKLLIPDTIWQAELIKNKTLGQNMLFTVMSGKNKGGIFWYDRKAQKINQWIIKDVEDARALDSQGPLTVYVSKTMKSPSVYYNIDFNPASKTYEAKQTMPPKGNALYDGPRQRFPSDGSANFLVRHVDFRIADGKIIQLRKDYHYHDKKNPKPDTVRFNVACDTAWVSKYIFGGSATWHSTHAYGNITHFKATDSTFEYENYILYRKKGKTGLIVEEAVIPPVYDDIRYFMAAIYEKPYFMVAQTINGKQKWGVIKSDGTLVLPIAYDQIIRGNGGGGSWLLKKDNLYGLADYLGKIIVPAIYENIVPGEYFLSFSIEHKGKYGFIRPSEGLFAMCQPVFSYKIQGPVGFGGYDVWELVDDKGKSLGFGDHKGFLYFKN